MSRRGRSGCRCCGYCPAGRIPGDSLSRPPLIYSYGDNGVRIQRTEFCISRLLAYRCIRTYKTAETIRGKSLLGRSDTTFYRDTIPESKKMAEDILQHCKPKTRLCIAINISCEDEFIVTRNVKAWKGKLPDMHKKPAVFLIYRG